MPSYMVKFRFGKNNKYVYPETVVAGTVWKTIVYHNTDPVMIGETDDDVQADGTEVIALKPAEAQRLMKEYRSAYPEPQEWLEELRPPRKG